MKKILFLILILISIASYGQADFPEGVQISGGQPTVSAVNFLTTVNVSNGLLEKIAPVNLPIPYTPVNYTISNQSIGQHLTGIDTRLGQISSTSAGITQRVYFTADNTTVNSVVYFASSLTGKGSTATGSPPALVLGDNTKSYFTKDIISIAQPTATIGYAGTYSGNLTVSASPTPNLTQQRFTVEIYRTNNLGVPIASGVSGAPTGDLGVTVLAILDSGVLNLTAGAITNVPVSGVLTQNITLNTGERLRYHVSAAKIGTGGGNVTFGVYYGSSYNSYYDVPVAVTTDAVVNKSTVSGVTSTDALNTLNTLKSNDVNVVHKTGSFTENIDGLKTLLDDLTLTTNKGIILNAGGTNRGSKIYNASMVNNYPSIHLSATGTNSASALSLTPKGTGFDPITKTVFNLYNTDALTDPSNYELLSLRASGNYFFIASGKIGSGVLRPLLLSSGFADLTSNPNQLWLYSSGRVGINNVTDNGISQLQVGGGGSFTTTTQRPLILQATTSGENYSVLKTISGSNLAYLGDAFSSIGVGSDSDMGIRAPSGNLILSALNNTRITNLSGTGTRNVAADSNGNLVISSIDTRPYKVYTALLSQTGTSAPTVVNVLENTLGGALVWTRNSTGEYYATLSGAFSGGFSKLAFSMTNNDYVSTTVTSYRFNQVNSNTVSLKTYLGITLTDSLIGTASIEIRVYP